MNKELVKDSSVKDGFLEKKKEENPLEYRAPFIPEIRKELNGWGKLFILGIWGLMAFLAGIQLTKKDDGYAGKMAELESKLDYLKAMEQKTILQARAEVDTRVSFVKSNLEKKYEDKLFELTSEQSKVLMEKNKLIDSIKNELNYEKLSSARSPASFKEGVMAYSYENADILKFKHRQKVKRLREAQKKREEIFLSAADLKDPKVRDIYIDMQEKHELEIFALKKTQQSEQERFRKEKFYVKN